MGFENTIVGKLVEVTGEKIIEATVASEIYDQLSDGYLHLVKWIH